MKEKRIYINRITSSHSNLMSELSMIGKTSKCKTWKSDKVRLIIYSEYYNMTPYYTTTNSNYPNVENITEIKSGDYESWLYCSSTDCGNSNGYWWTMGSYSGSSYDFEVSFAYTVGGPGNIASDWNHMSYVVRPGITVVK